MFSIHSINWTAFLRSFKYKGADNFTHVLPKQDSKNQLLQSRRCRHLAKAETWFRFPEPVHGTVEVLWAKVSGSQEEWQPLLRFEQSRPLNALRQCLLTEALWQNRWRSTCLMGANRVYAWVGFETLCPVKTETFLSFLTNGSASVIQMDSEK